MVPVFLFVGWFTGSAMVVFVLVLDGTGLHMVVGTVFHLIAFGMVFVGGAVGASLLSKPFRAGGK